LTRTVVVQNLQIEKCVFYGHEPAVSSGKTACYTIIFTSASTRYWALMQRTTAKVQSELSSLPSGSRSPAENVRYSSFPSNGLQHRDVEDHKSSSDRNNADSDENFLIYDSFSLHFNWRTVLEQLALNITFPLLIPLFIHLVIPAFAKLLAVCHGAHTLCPR
jgi:hypothetical protein